MTPSEAVEFIRREQKRIVAENVALFFSDLLKRSPVDTGAFRSAWTLQKKSDTSWTIFNGMQYASILWDGRRLVGSQWFGSEQWPEGGESLLLWYNKKIENDFKKVVV